MVKAHGPWPCPQRVAWPSPDLNCSCKLPEPTSCHHSTYLNPSTCIFPAVSVFPGFTAHATPSLKTEHTNEVQGFFQNHNSELCSKATHTGGSMHDPNRASSQKKLLIFDQSGDRTRLFYSPMFPLVENPVVTAPKFAQAYDANEGGEATSVGEKHLSKYDSPEESIKDHVVNEESEMHEDTEEINALLYSDDSGSDDDDDEVTSTGHSPLASKRTYVMQEQFKDTNEEVASSDWPNKRHKLIDGGYCRLPPPVESASSSRLNETCEYVSDAESKYSTGCAYYGEQSKIDTTIAGDTQMKREKIRKLLRVLENLIPGAKGKHPLLVIDGAIEYLKSLMSQTGTTVKYH